MRTTLVATWIALTISSLWAQRPRKLVSPASLARSEVRQARISSRRPRGDVAATAVTQAPGVVQLEYLNGTATGWFVTTDTIPNGSSIAITVAHSNGSVIDCDALSLTSDVGPGQSYRLPNVASFGDLWSGGLVTYVVYVTTNGRESQSAADFAVAASRNYSDVQSMIPLITSTTQTVNAGRDVILAIRGSFTRDAPYVILDDYIVPGNAVALSPREIDVNLSRVPGLDLSILGEYALTVGQAGWSDTMVYRYIPAAPGTFNPAP